MWRQTAGGYSGSGEVTGKLHGSPFGVSLSLRLIAYSCGAARLRITETNPLNGPRWSPTDILEAGLAAVPLTEVTAASLGASHPLHADVTSGAVSAYGFGAEGAVVAITYHPFKAVVYLGEVSVMTLNPQGKFYWDTTQEGRELKGAAVGRLGRARRQDGRRLR